jgi:cell division protein FtsI (penicillin-binding protein 3)
VAEQTVNAWQRTIRGRVVIAAILFATWAVVIEAQLVRLQVFDHAELQMKADSQSKGLTRVPARRGDIVDRHGQVLATSVDADVIFAVPTEVDDPAGTAQALCNAMSGCAPGERDDIAEKLSQPRSFTYVRRANRVLPEDARRVAALKLPGIGFIKDTRRAYPNSELAAHLLGYVGTDNIGLNGLEQVFDKNISGRDGRVLIETDNHHHPFGRAGRAAIQGATLQLAIDQYLQHLTERELHAAVEENHAAGGSALIMDPHTGDILAMANEPTFDPNKYGDAGPDSRRNRAIQDVYEPGSTFKIVTASAALEEHVMTPDSLIDVSGGLIRLGSRVVHDTHNYGVLSFTDVIVKSSNVGAIRIGLQLGAERLGRYVHRFGFGTRLSPDFPGENAGLLWDPASWSQSALASVSMGYQISVTPLQMATAACVVANGGELVQPRVVKSITSSDGVRTDVTPRVVRRAILKSTADALTSIMEGVTERGTAKAASIPGYSVAGKTGTAHKVEHGVYSQSDYNASFVGFLPSRQPVLTILVMIDSPHGHGYFGGSVAAPVFKRIAEPAMRYLGIAPTGDSQPVLVARQVATRPAVPSSAAPPDAARIVRTATARPDAPGVVPDVVGLSAREAIRVLARFGMTARVSGDGVVLQQEPRPGSTLDPGAACTLALGRPAAVGTGPDQRQ